MRRSGGWKTRGGGGRERGGGLVRRGGGELVGGGVFRWRGGCFGVGFIDAGGGDVWAVRLDAVEGVDADNDHDMERDDHDEGGREAGGGLFGLAFAFVGIRGARAAAQRGGGGLERAGAGARRSGRSAALETWDFQGRWP